MCACKERLDHHVGSPAEVMPRVALLTSSLHACAHDQAAVIGECPHDAVQAAHLEDRLIALDLGGHEVGPLTRQVLVHH